MFGIKKKRISVCFGSGFDVQVELEVLLVFRLGLERLADGEAGLVVVLLYETASREVVMGLIVTGVELQRLLVALDGLLELPQGKVGIPHVLEHRVLLLQLEAVLQQEDGFGGSAQ